MIARWWSARPVAAARTARPPKIRRRWRRTLLDAAAHGPVAVLFGPEDHGLTNDDLRVCQRLISIDTVRRLRLAEPGAGGAAGL